MTRRLILILVCGWLAPLPAQSRRPWPDPLVARFLREEDPPATLVYQSRMQGHDLVYFVARITVPGAEPRERHGVRYRGLIGWLPEDSTSRHPRDFRLPARDPLFHSAAFARYLRGSGLGWRYPFGPFLARNPNTPLEALRLTARYAPGLHAELRGNPRARFDLPILLALREPAGIPADEWERLLHPALLRSAADPEVDSAALRGLLGSLGEREPRTDVAAVLVRNPAVRRNPPLLRELYLLDPARYPGLRREATGAMLALPHLPEAFWLQVHWWETHPQALGDRRLRDRVDVLTELRGLVDPSTSPEVRAGIDRMLLEDPGTPTEAVLGITYDALEELRRCRPRTYPARAILRAALRHPRAAEDPRIAQVVMRLYEEPALREVAYRRLHGGPMPPEVREHAAPADLPEGRLRSAHVLAAYQVYRVEGWADSVNAVLNRWEARGVHRSEVGAWRRFLERHPDDDSAFAALVSSSRETDGLRAASPFLALLRPEELDRVGVGCELLPP